MNVFNKFIRRGLTVIISAALAFFGMQFYENYVYSANPKVIYKNTIRPGK